MSRVGSPYDWKSGYRPRILQPGIGSEYMTNGRQGSIVHVQSTKGNVIRVKPSHHPSSFNPGSYDRTIIVKRTVKTPLTEVTFNSQSVHQGGKGDTPRLNPVNTPCPTVSHQSNSDPQYDFQFKRPYLPHKRPVQRKIGYPVKVLNIKRTRVSPNFSQSQPSQLGIQRNHIQHQQITPVNLSTLSPDPQDCLDPKPDVTSISQKNDEFGQYLEGTDDFSQPITTNELFALPTTAYWEPPTIKPNEIESPNMTTANAHVCTSLEEPALASPRPANMTPPLSDDDICGQSELVAPPTFRSQCGDQEKRARLEALIYPKDQLSERQRVEEALDFDFPKHRNPILIRDEDPFLSRAAYGMILPCPCSRQREAVAKRRRIKEKRR